MRKAVELRQILDGLEKVNDEGRRANLLDQLLSSDDVLTLPEHSNPPGIETGNLTVNLLKHQVRIQTPTRTLDILTFLQKQALLWCIDRENPTLPKSETDHPVQFWQLKRNNGKVSVCFNRALQLLTRSVSAFLLQSCVTSPFLSLRAFNFLEVATKTPQEAPPKLGRGALCADSMGL